MELETEKEAGSRMKQNRKRLKRKRRSCSMCKPHKTGGCDRRDVGQKREDEKLKGDELLRLAKVGLIALIDEATGFQAVRGKSALRKIAEKMVDTKAQNT